MPMRPPDYDRKPLYHDGVGVGWVGYGMFDEWPSASFRIFVWKEHTGENECLSLEPKE